MINLSISMYIHVYYNVEVMKNHMIDALQETISIY